MKSIVFVVLCSLVSVILAQSRNISLVRSYKLSVLNDANLPSPLNEGQYLKKYALDGQNYPTLGQFTYCVTAQDEQSIDIKVKGFEIITIKDGGFDMGDGARTTDGNFPYNIHYILEKKGRSWTNSNGQAFGHIGLVGWTDINSEREKFVNAYMNYNVFMPGLNTKSVVDLWARYYKNEYEHKTFFDYPWGTAYESYVYGSRPYSFEVYADTSPNPIIPPPVISAHLANIVYMQKSGITSVPANQIYALSLSELDAGAIANIDFYFIAFDSDFDCSKIFLITYDSNAVPTFHLVSAERDHSSSRWRSDYFIPIYTPQCESSYTDSNGVTYHSLFTASCFDIEAATIPEFAANWLYQGKYDFNKDTIVNLKDYAILTFSYWTLTEYP